jgi:uncharacterized membrane protein
MSQLSRFERRRKFIRSFEAKSLRSRSLSNQVADDLTMFSGSMAFLTINCAIFLVWILVNTGLVPGIPVFDPFPFGLLTMFVSLEAIVLSILVLISQNRSTYIGTLRDEVHMQINLQAEEEITKILQLLSQIRTKLGITKPDSELAAMLEHTSPTDIEARILAQLERANKTIWEKMTREFPDFRPKVKKENGSENGQQNGNGTVQHVVQVS